MAKKTSIINVVVAGDSKPLRNALGKATKSLGTMTKQIGKFSLAAGAAFAAVGAKSIGLAVDFEESLSKANQIFGDAAKGIETSAKGAASAVGLSQAEFLEAASSFGVFGKAAGLTGGDLATFSDDLVTVAADVASFNNLKPEEALTKLQAGLRGSNEPLQSIGVLINAAGVEAKALEMGLAGANGEISEGNKIMARQALILEQLGKQGALGDFERTSGGLANQQRILTARFKNLGIALGKILLPIAEKVSRVISKLLTFGEKLSVMYGEKGFKGTVKELGKQLIKLWTPLKKGIKTITVKTVKALGKLANKFVEWIRPKIRPMLSKLLEWVQAIGNFILEKLPLVAGKIGQLAAAFLEWVGPLAKKLLVKLPTIVATIVEWLATKAIPKIVEAGLKLAEHLVPALLSFGKDVLEGIGSIIGQIGGAIGRGFVNMGSYALDEAGAFGNKILDAMMKPINFMGDMVKSALDVVVNTFKSVYNTLADL